MSTTWLVSPKFVSQLLPECPASQVSGLADAQNAFILLIRSAAQQMYSSTGVSVLGCVNWESPGGLALETNAFTIPNISKSSLQHKHPTLGWDTVYGVVSASSGGSATSVSSSGALVAAGYDLLALVCMPERNSSDAAISERLEPLPRLAIGPARHYRRVGSPIARPPVAAAADAER